MMTFEEYLEKRASMRKEALKPGVLKTIMRVLRSPAALNRERHGLGEAVDEMYDAGGPNLLYGILGNSGMYRWLKSHGMESVDDHMTMDAWKKAPPLAWRDMWRMRREIDPQVLKDLKTLGVMGTAAAGGTAMDATLIGALAHRK